MTGAEIVFYILIFITFMVLLWLVWYKRRIAKRYAQYHKTLQEELNKAVGEINESTAKDRREYQKARDDYRKMIEDLQSDDLPEAN